MNETVLDTLARILEEILGEDFADEISITRDTSFAEDLELESIEFVTLAEKLQAHYGDSVNFVAWVSDMELDQIIGLSVGQVEEYITQCLS